MVGLVTLNMEIIAFGLIIDLIESMIFCKEFVKIELELINVRLQ